ncbi:hypothetical protein ONZ45_g15591 [Pleurotus djamor]|nr:hypothetical protein ONZ45_g15591 [Pleurotus djamor]
MPMPGTPAAVDEIFHSFIYAQADSNEIAVWSPELERICQIAYPITKEGERIVPDGIRDYLRRRQKLWVCFCAVVSGEPTSCRIVDGETTGETYAFCYFNPSRCGFFNIPSFRQMGVDKVLGPTTQTR